MPFIPDSTQPSTIKKPTPGFVPDVGPSEDQKLGIDTGFERFLAPVLRPARRFGRDVINPALTKIARTPIPENLQPAAQAVETVGETLTGNPLYRETAGAFMRGNVQGDVGVTSDIYKKPQTPVGKGVQAAGYITGMFNPESVINKTIGLVAKAPGIKQAGEAVDRAIMDTKVLAPFKKGYKAEIETLAKRRGIDLPMSAVTDSPVVQSAEALAQRGLFGQKINEKFVAAKEAIGTELNNLTQKFVKEIDNKEVGDVLKKGFDDFQKTFRKKKDELYSSIPNELETAPAVLEDTKQALQSIIEQKSKSLVPDSTLSFYRKTLDGIKSAEKKGGSLLADLRQTRTLVGSKLNSFIDPIATGDKAALNRLYGALSDDLDNTISQHSPEAAEALKKANDFYREGIELINGKIGKKIQNLDPEKVFTTLSGSNSRTAIETMKSIVGEEGYKRFQDSFMQKLLNDSTRVKDGERVLDYTRLLNTINRYGEKNIKKILLPGNAKAFDDVVKNLDEISKIQRSIVRGSKIAEGSQTAYLANISTAIPLLFANVGAGIANFATQYVGGKALQSPIMRDILTKGTTIKTPEIIKKTVGVGKKAVPGIIKKVATSSLEE